MMLVSLNPARPRILQNRNIFSHSLFSVNWYYCCCCCCCWRAEYLQQFYRCHSDRQGIAVLGFDSNDVETIHQRYQASHPDLIHSYREYPAVVGDDGTVTKILQVYSYYEGKEEDHDGNNQGNTISKQPDHGTLLRFTEKSSDEVYDDSFCSLPGLTKVNSTFDSTSLPAYCDHWVSNVHSRTDFWNTLEDVLDFTPKVRVQYRFCTESCNIT